MSDASNEVSTGNIIELWLCITSGGCFGAAVHNFWAGACFSMVTLLIWSQSEDWRTAYRSKK